MMHMRPSKRLSEEVFISPFSATAQFCKSNGFWYACACRWLRRLDISHGSVHIKLAVVVISGGIKGKVNLVSSIFLSGWTYLGKQVVFVAVEQRWVISFKLFKLDITFTTLKDTMYNIIDLINNNLYSKGTIFLNYGQPAYHHNSILSG